MIGADTCYARRPASSLRLRAVERINASSEAGIKGGGVGSACLGVLFVVDRHKPRGVGAVILLKQAHLFLGEARHCVSGLP